MSLRVDDFDYFLPEELIAQRPLAERDRSRLLVVDRQSGKVEHSQVFKLGEWLRPGDLLVFNDTRVIPARLWGKRVPGGGRIEVLLLKDLDGERWEALVRPGRKVHFQDTLAFGGEEGKRRGLPSTPFLLAQVEETTDFGGRVLHFNQCGAELRQTIKDLGQVPLPPYIKEELADEERYQTVYARNEGSAAAPTAGLHFTPELLADLERKGVNLAFLTLHVGLGTFRPVKTERVEEHQMHAEFYQLHPELVSAVQKAKSTGGRVISVGTTAVRALESAAQDDGSIIPGQGWTEIFIYPGYKFKVIEGLITNFHLPRSTLLMLVSAFAGRELTLSVYKEAVQNRYRFFSFGDAMFIM